VTAAAPELAPAIEPRWVAPNAPFQSRALGTAVILALQRSSGNAAVTGLLRKDRDAKHEPLATAEDVRQLNAIAVKPLNICIFQLTTGLDPGTGDVDAATLTEVEEKVREIAAAVQVIANSKEDPRQRDRYYDANDDVRDALATLQVRNRPPREKPKIWIDALTRALAYLDRVMALPVLKPGATADSRLEPIDMPLTQRDHDLLKLSVRPQLAALLKRAHSPGFKPKEEATDDTLASMLTAVDHRGLSMVRVNVHKAQHAMLVFTMPSPTAMREAAVQNLADAQRKLAAIMATAEAAKQPVP